MADVGLPDGFVGSFAVRAHHLLGAHVGLGHNTNSFGLRGGVSFTPIQFLVAPYLALEAGHYLEADTASWMRSTAKKAGLDDKTLGRVGYSYANGHLGVRFGSGHAALFLQGGISYIDATAQVIKPKPNFIPPVDLYRETIVHVWTVSARGGVLFYF
jgi:hypothetical protein